MTQPNLQPSPQTLAEQCADAMFSRDEASQQLGMEIRSVQPGGATLTMTVDERMIQGHGNCHGGYLFALADSAFAFACNTYDRTTVAAGCSIEYVAAARLGDLLTATATERSRGRRTGVYDIEITNQEGRTVALFRGKSYQVQGSVREPGDTQQ